MPDTPNFPADAPRLSDPDKELVRIYEEIGRSVDLLAYTPEFDDLYQRFTDAGFRMERQDVFRRLLVLRKAGLLPRLFRSGSLE